MKIFLSLLFTFGVFSLLYAQQPPPPKADSVKFPITYQEKILFTGDSAFPVTVSISDLVGQSIFKVIVNDSNPFTLSTPLPSGTYRIESSVSSENEQLYWEALGPQIFIQPDGTVTYGNSNNDHTLTHEKKLIMISPDPTKPVTTTTEKRPLIQWQPLPGATHYQLLWLIEEAPLNIVGRGRGETDETEFRLPEDVVPNRRYELSVHANGKDGNIIGYWSASYFYTIGGEEAFAKNPPPTSATKGMPYLGLIPRKLVGTDGLVVQGVRGNSPAMKAGLQPQDILTSFNGKPLDKASEAEFVAMVRALGVGAHAPVEYLRDKEKKSTEVTIEAMP